VIFFLGFTGEIVSVIPETMKKEEIMPDYGPVMDFCQVSLCRKHYQKAVFSLTYFTLVTLLLNALKIPLSRKVYFLVWSKLTAA
jgi:hypothetical protein